MGFLRKLLISAILLILVSCLPVQGKPVEEEEGVLSTLAEQDLAGRLVFVRLVHPQGNRLTSLDLATGELRDLFTPPDKAYLASADVSSDEKQIVLAYAPPPESGVQFTYTGLFLMPADGSAPPEALLEREIKGESYSYPSWSPDGRAVVYTHTLPADSVMNGVEVRVERLALGGEPEVLVQNAMWPRLSPDGQRLAYLSVDLDQNTNELYLAGADGQNPSAALPPGEYPAVDAHTFSPDGQFIYFSAVNPAGAGAAPVEITGRPDSGAVSLWASPFWAARPVSAHDVGSDFYRVPVGGGEVRRLTYLNGIGMYAGFSPGGQSAAVGNRSGIYIMNLTGSELVMVAKMPVVGPVNWVE